MAINVRPEKPTLAAVALQAGVSTPTVSKVVNGREDVAPETRARVMDALAPVVERRNRLEIYSEAG